MNAPMNVEVISLGCRMNLAESEALRTLLGSAGQSAEDRDLVVVNSCAVTAEALRQTRQAIRRARRSRPQARLIVTGCAAEVERAMMAAMPEVDGLVANQAKLDARAWNLPASGPASARPASSATHSRAFVAVQNGCDHACSFCIIPQGRGPSRSRSVAEVVDEIRASVAAGVGEAVLTGVDLTAWGLDLPGNPRLGALVGAILSGCPELPRLRLSSLDGVEIDDELFELLAGEARVMPHLHLSLQHGHDLILKRMKRRHLRRDAVELVERLKARRPDIAIGADLIAGFPTESPEHHAANLAVVRDLGIVHGHVFPYSIRLGTPAARMPQLAPALIAARAAEMRAQIAAEHERWLARLIGTPLMVLAERDGTGHAGNFARVKLPEAMTAGTLAAITPTRIVQGLLV